MAATKKRSFRTAGILNVAISGVVALLSYVSLTLVAARFGGSLGSDAYFFLFSLTTIASTVITSLFGVVLVPLFIDLKMNMGLEKAEDFAGSILSLCFIVILPGAVCAYLWHDEFFRLVSKYDAQQIGSTRFVLIYFAPIFVLTVIGEFFRFLVIALGRYTLAAVGSLFQPLFLIIFVVELSARYAEESMPLALLVARGLALVFLLAIVFGIERIKLPMFRKPGAAVGNFVKVSGPYWAANLVTNFSSFYFDYTATGLAAGILTAISYANRLFSLPISVIIGPVMEIARARFAEIRAAKDDEVFKDLYGKLSRGMVYFSIPVAVAFVAFSRDIIRMMFQRGAFTEESVAISASCLSIYAISIPLVAIFQLNGRAVESTRRLAWPSLFGTIGHFSLVFLTHELTTRLGYIGIPMAKVLMDLIYFLPLGFVFYRLFVGGVAFGGLIKASLIALVASLLPLAAYYAAGYSWEGGVPRSLILTVLLLGGYFFAYGIVIVVFDRKILPLSRFRNWRLRNN